MYYFSNFMFSVKLVCFPCLVFVPGLHSCYFCKNLGSLDYSWYSDIINFNGFTICDLKFIPSLTIVILKLLFFFDKIKSGIRKYGLISISDEIMFPYSSIVKFIKPARSDIVLQRQPKNHRNQE